MAKDKRKPADTVRKVKEYVTEQRALLDDVERASGKGVRRLFEIDYAVLELLCDETDLGEDDG